MLDLITIEKRYKDYIVFSNVTIHFEEGKLYILQGVNGSGKSTLLKLLVGIIYKTSGTLAKSGLISYLPDKFSFPKLMKVKNYLIEALDFKDNKSEYEKLISKYQIPNKRIGDLSKGNWQKLGILQIMANEATTYILDEPLDGLDENAKKLFKETVKEKLSSNKTVILALHNKTFFNDLNPIILDVKEGTILEKKKKTRKSIDTIS